MPDSPIDPPSDATPPAPAPHDAAAPAEAAPLIEPASPLEVAVPTESPSTVESDAGDTGGTQPAGDAVPASESAPASAPTSGTTAASTPPQPPPVETGVRLRQRFPALFGSRAKPIKLQVQQDIQTRAPGEFSRRELSAFFSRYTRSTPYLIAVSRATERFGLDGEPSGALADEHREAALQELAKRRASRHEREALEEQQRRNRARLLHDFERTTLTAANFCALKGVEADELDGLLARAREEATQRPLPPPSTQRPGPARRPRHE